MERFVVGVPLNDQDQEMRLGTALMACLSLMAIGIAGLAYVQGAGMAQIGLFAALAGIGMWQVFRASRP
jgi:hypothetical protein